MAKGTFVWHELMTTDVDAGKAFFAEVVGWKTTSAPMKDGFPDYHMFCVGELPTAGVMQLPEEAAKMNVPPHWLGHVEVSDAAAIAKKIPELGGKVLKDPMAVPGIGTFVIFSDPQGAVVSAFQPEGEQPPKPAGSGTIGWNELSSTDHEAGFSFYSELFGWEITEDMDMGEGMGIYRMYKNKGGDKPLGGMSSVAKAMDFPPHWGYYISVDDLDAALERVKANGGNVVGGPMDVPGGDRIANCMDPQGAAFSLHWASQTAS